MTTCYTLLLGGVLLLFVVRCRAELGDSLAERVRAEKAAEREWWRARKAEQPEDLSPAQRARWLAAAQAAYEVERGAGRLSGTRSAVVVPALRDELAERGWLARTWRPVPAGHRSRKARPWGTTDRRWTARVALDIPDDLGQVLARGCHWSSAPHIKALQRWYGRHGEAHRGTHRGGRVWRGLGPSNAELAERDRLQAAIVTTGMVLRAAICRALDIDPVPNV
ncbi:hypothetical protein [Micromonospora sp. CPCC 206061]|uniref:hypothetical protein n=1 Tax=Micromonospora sp. CPCC 206061 TaxID=3122410 RepID=UPI002FF2020C